MKKQKMTAALICGMLGCLCYGGGDWLMMYGDTAHDGSVYWLTRGLGAPVQRTNICRIGFGKLDIVAAAICAASFLASILNKVCG